jgi:hypothetical protein
MICIPLHDLAFLVDYNIPTDNLKHSHLIMQ